MIENYKELKKFLSTIDKNNKPSLLLHSCCAPCSSYTIMFLKEYFNVTVFYDNDNIYPESEFFKRLSEQKRFAKNFGINVLFDSYDQKRFDEQIKGYEHKGERSIRCYNCYLLRLTRTCLAAKKNNFDYFSTTLSISPYKLSKWINKIGYELEEKYNMPFLYSDFKKEEGYKESIKLSQEYDLYRQDYCGCKYSLEEKNAKETN